jgi:hypothetical protein
MRALFFVLFIATVGSYAWYIFFLTTEQQPMLVTVSALTATIWLCFQKSLAESLKSQRHQRDSQDGAVFLMTFIALNLALRSGAYYILGWNNWSCWILSSIIAMLGSLASMIIGSHKESWSNRTYHTLW